MTATPLNLLDAVSRGRVAASAQLRGLDGQWATTEQAIAASVRANPRTAARLVDSYARFAKACGEDEPRGRAARLRASYLAWVGRNADAADHFRRARRILRGAARDHTTLGLAVTMIRMGRFGDAVRLCREVRAAASGRGETMLAASADLNAGLSLHESGRPESALELYRRALPGLEPQPAFAARAKVNLANALVLLDRFEEALPIYDEAAATFEELAIPHEAARLRYNRGALFVVMDRLGDADRELSGAERDLLRRGDALAAGLARLDRGEALLRAGLLADAQRALDSAAKTLARGGPQPEIVRASLLRARLAVLRGEFATARKILGRASPAPRAWDADRRELLGLAYAGERRFGEARAELRRAAQGYGGARPSARSRATCAAGWCALEVGDVAAARRLALSAQRGSDRLPIPSLSFAAAALRFEVEHAAGNRRAAAAALKSAFAHLEEMRDLLGPDPMRSAVLRGRERFLARAVRHTLDGPRGEERALALIERWRARALVDLMNSAARLTEGGGRLAQLRARVAAIERRLEGGTVASFLRTQERARPPELARSLARAERALAEESGRGVEARRAPQFSVRDLTRGVEPGTVLLSLYADDRGGTAFLLRETGVRAVALPTTDADLRGLVEELYFRMGKFALGPTFVERQSRRLAAETDRILAAIAQRTLAPLGSELHGVERIVIAPHGAWHQVPFAALPFRGGRLVDSFHVALTPALAALGSKLPVAAGRPIVLAAADPRAPTIAEEGVAVAAGAPDALHLAGDAATSDALRCAEPPRFVHIAAHGRFRADVPGLSGVRLADGWLRAIDFGSLVLTGSLVVLSGCETGVSQIDAGGEVQGLVRGVMASGASDVVVSLWRVDDAATAKLMSAFHALRASGLAPDVALARAQRDAAAGGLHPWYWAGFTAWTRRLSNDA